MAILPPLTTPVVVRCEHGDNRNSCVRCAMNGARHRARGLVTSPLRPSPLGDSAADALFGAALNAVAEHLGDHPKAKMFKGDPKVTTPFGLATAVSAEVRGPMPEGMTSYLLKQLEACSSSQARYLYEQGRAYGERMTKDIVAPPSDPGYQPIYGRMTKDAVPPTSTQRESVGVDPRAPYRVMMRLLGGGSLYASDAEKGGVGIERLTKARTFRTLAEARAYAASDSVIAMYCTTRTIHIVDARMIEVEPWAGAPPNLHGPFSIRLKRTGEPPLYAPRKGNHFAQTEQSEAASFHTLEETRAYLSTLCNWAGSSNVFIVDGRGVEIESATATKYVDTTIVVHHTKETNHPLGWPAPPTEERTVLIRGNTYPVKDAIKALGGRWDAYQNAWHVPASMAERAQALVAAVPLAESFAHRVTGRVPPKF